VFLSKWVVAALAAVSGFSASPYLQAQFTFGPTHQVHLPSPGYRVIPLDMNGDGNTDLYLPLQSGNYIYLGDGKGGFSTTPIKAHESVSNFMFPPVFYDVNGDGFADEVYAYPGYVDQYPGESYNGVFAVLLGDGKGNFTETTNLTLPVGNGGPGILVDGDFNRDGKVDFATIGGNEENGGYDAELTVLMNTGGGKFQFGYTEDLSDFNPSALTRGDFNGDGKQDLVWTDQTSENGHNNQLPVHCLLGNGNGTFGADHVCYVLDGEINGVAAADFNRDGKTDLLLLAGPKLDSNGQPVAGSRPRLITLLAKAGGFFWSSSVTASGMDYGVSILDLNGDGKPDAFVNYGDLYENKGNGVFSAPQSFREEYGADAIPLTKNGLAALFFITDDNSGDYYVNYRINTSPK
jgi:hypothetical protein